MRNENNESRGGGLLLGLVTGAVAGAVTAILLAPSSGAETRRKLMKNTEQLRDNINDTVQAGLDKINELRGSLEADEITGPISGRVQTKGEGPLGSPASSTSTSSATGANRGNL